MKSDGNDALEQAQDAESGAPETELKLSVSAGERSGGLKVGHDTAWPRPYAEVSLPHWEHSVDLERLHTAVEARLAEMSVGNDPEYAPDGGYVLGVTSAVAGEGKT